MTKHCPSCTCNPSSAAPDAAAAPVLVWTELGANGANALPGSVTAVDFTAAVGAGGNGMLPQPPLRVVTRP